VCSKQGRPEENKDAAFEDDSLQESMSFFPSCVSVDYHPDTVDDNPEPPNDKDSGKGEKLLQ
jgi:hypothetical protein